MGENSGNGRFNIKKYIRYFLICVFTLGIMIILSIAGLIGYMFYTVYTPPRDSVYIGYLELFAGDSLPSCRVMNKKYEEGSYTTAIYRVNESDFQKVLEGVQNYEYLDTIAPVKYNDVAIQLLRKEKNHEISQLDYSYSLSAGDKQFGFKRPDIILYFRRCYD